MASARGSGNGSCERAARQHVLAARTNAAARSENACMTPLPPFPVFLFLLFLFFPLLLLLLLLL
eukprot:8188019-Pyramimonas_sp.AAC.1